MTVQSEYWQLSHRTDPIARAIADRHYNRQKIGATGFVPPGRCLVLRGVGFDAVWVTSWPYAAYVLHAWAGAWVNSLFRRESGPLASDLIRDAVAITRWYWPRVPDLGMVTFIDTTKTKRKRDHGRSYLRAGFDYAACPVHAYLDLIVSSCAACQSRTKAGLVAVQMMSADMPDPMAPCRRLPSVRRTRIISE